jgi:hypothetical protein
MATIKFERVTRDCGHNKTILDAGESKGLLYDFNVIIDGEHRATMSRNGYSVGYTLRDADYNSIRDLAKADKRWRSHPVVEVGKQADFEDVINCMLAAGLIPTLDQMAAVRAEKAAKIAANKAAEDERDRIHRIQGAAVDLYAALKPLAVYLADNGGDAEYHDADGTGWLSRAQAAIAKAEGRT